MIKASEAIVKCLECENVKVVFGYPGAAICPFYDALSHSDINHILVRHEVNAGHAASGYARISGAPGVCVATSGPGSTNLITAIATAYMDSVPLIIITGQVSTDLIGRDVFQEADITGAAEPFVKHSYLIKNAQELPHIFKEAFYIASSGRPGPVLIDIPVDIQETMINFEYPQNVSIRSYKPTIKGNKLQIKRIITALEESKKPLICTGGGVILSNSQRELSIFSSCCNIPVVSTMMGLSCMPDDNPLYFGMIGLYGSECANRALRDCDLLIVIGARFGDRAVNSPNILSPDAKIIHIDIDPAEIGKNIKTDIPVVGNAKKILVQLLEMAEPMKHTQWLSHLEAIRTGKKVDLLSKNNRISPEGFLYSLSKALPDNTNVVADVGLNQLYCANHFYLRKGRFLTSGGMGTMGYSIPAAIGAKLADRSCETVAVCGDGAFMMQMMELSTAVQHNVNIKIIIVDNNCLGMIKDMQDKYYGGNEISVNLTGNPDFIKLSEAFGIKAMRVYDEASSLKAIDCLVHSEGPFLIDLITDSSYKSEEGGCL